MKKGIIISLFACSALMAGSDLSLAEPAIVKTRTNFSLLSDVYGKGESRLRYETVSTANAILDAKALTNRLTLGVGANLLSIDGLSSYLEATNVSGSGDFWDLSHNDSNQGIYNVVADPSQTRITQAYVDYKIANTLIRAGRQGVNLDNQRFIGTVDWRQMPQTYDAVSVSNQGIENLSLLGAYVWRVNTIFDSNTVKPVGDSFDTGSVLLHADYKVLPELTLTGYSYLLEDIHDTYGLAATGKISLAESFHVAYRAEYAKQSNPSLENTTSDLTADADYYNIKATFNLGGVLLGGGYEVLGSGENGEASFSTPLSTLHAHNGWVDQFLSTPVNGLKDITAMIGYKSKSFGVAKIIYHDFSSDANGIDYGTEIDLLYKRSIPGIKGLSALVKAGLYKADTFKVDTDKYWAMLDYKF